jgi:hypothetical protein
MDFTKNLDALVAMVGMLIVFYTIDRKTLHD